MISRIQLLTKIKWSRNERASDKNLFFVDDRIGSRLFGSQRKLREFYLRIFPATANANQLDLDGDGEGDVCDMQENDRCDGALELELVNGLVEIEGQTAIEASPDPESASCGGSTT